jgi:hypothetical protein
VAEHSAESDHWIKFHETDILIKMSGYMDQLVKEVIEVKSYLDN